jgi:hypothetical protein
MVCLPSCGRPASTWKRSAKTSMPLAVMRAAPSPGGRSRRAQPSRQPPTRGTASSRRSDAGSA